MNGKKAKALRRLDRALEQEKLAFQEMLRRGTPVPVKTMSMDDFNKARSQVAEDGVGVISTTPRTPDIDEDNLALEETESAAIEQEVKLRLLQQNAKHYIGIDEMEGRVDKHFDINDKMTLTREDAFKAASPELLLESRRAAKALLPAPSEKELDRMHASINGPEAYAKIGSMGNNPPYRVSDACGDRGVVCRIDPDVPVDAEGNPSDIVIFGKDRFKPSSFKDKE